jgi:purine-binding chemotaxis protein CheW
MQTATGTDLRTELEFATFHVGDTLLALDIRCIRDINDNLKIFNVPGAPSCIRGVINLRGDVVSVVDPRVIVQGQSTHITHETRNIIVDAQGEHIAMLVDRVLDVMVISNDEIEACPANLGGIDGKFFSGVIRLENQILVVFNVDAVLAAVTDAVGG